jgi:hypothetical protein
MCTNNCFGDWPRIIIIIIIIIIKIELLFFRGHFLGTRLDYFYALNWITTIIINSSSSRLVVVAVAVVVAVVVAAAVSM